MLDIGGDKMYGDLNMNGHTILNQGAMVEANLQTAAEMASDKIARFAEGDVLCWRDDQLEKCSQTADPMVLAVADVNGKPIVIGAEKIRVIGPVTNGDFLIASSRPGYAMATSNPGIGTVIGQALEDFPAGKGLIKAMIRKY